MRRIKGKWDTLEEVLSEVWSMLKRGASHFNDPFHRAVLGTVGEHGSSLRMVILREVIVAERILVCHTDARAAKAQEITESDTVSWLFYHPKKKIQLRVAGRAILHTEDRFADGQWEATGVASRFNYGTTESPGTSIDRPSSGLPDFLLNKVPSIMKSESVRKNFMAISCGIDSVDWLRLSTLGHRRARFEWDEYGLKATWLVP
jgi:pyridoxamine 5'-phosphate oxidase